MLTGGKDLTSGIPEDTDAFFISALPVALAGLSDDATLFERKSLRLKAHHTELKKNLDGIPDIESSKVAPVRAEKSTKEKKVSVAPILLHGGTVEGATKVRPGNKTGPVPDKRPLVDKTHDHSHGLPATEVIRESDDVASSGEIITDHLAKTGTEKTDSNET